MSAYYTRYYNMLSVSTILLSCAAFVIGICLAHSIQNVLHLRALLYFVLLGICVFSVFKALSPVTSMVDNFLTAVNAFASPSVSGPADIIPDFDYSMCPAILNEPGFESDVTDIAKGYDMLKSHDEPLCPGALVPVLSANVSGNTDLGGFPAFAHYCKVPSTLDKPITSANTAAFVKPNSVHVKTVPEGYDETVRRLTFYITP